MKAGLWAEDFTARSGVSLDSWRREMSVLLSTAWHRPRKIGLFSGEFIRQLGRIYDLFDNLLRAPHRLQPGRPTVPLQHIPFTLWCRQRICALVLARGIAVLQDEVGLMALIDAGNELRNIHDATAHGWVALLRKR